MTHQFNQMKRIKERVKFLLTKTPHLRDSDAKLIATFWHSEIGGTEKLELMTGMDLLHLFANGKLTSTESIRRVRCKIMEQYPELRGET
jgi:hypothetical protein